MPRAWKIWFLCAFVILCIILTAGYFNKLYAVGLIWSFIEGEWAIGFWMKIGVPFKLALPLVVVPSVIDIFNWFWLADRQVIPILKRFYILTPKEKTIDRVKKSPYLYMPFLGVAPGGIFLGIGICKLLRMDKRVTFILLAIGNSVKMVLFGLGFATAGIIFGVIAAAGLTFGLANLSRRFL